MNRRVKYTRALLAQAAAESCSLVDMMRRLGAPLGSGSRRYLRNRLTHYGINTAHFGEKPLPERPRMVYSKELLEEAAAHSTSIREMLAYMDVPPYDSAYTHIQKKLDQFEISTAHFVGKRGNGTNQLLPQDKMQRAVAESQSLAEVMRILKLPNGGAGRALVQRTIAAYGISTDHFVGQGHQRGRPALNRKPAAAVLRKLDPGAARTRTSLLRRALEESAVPRACDECGTGDTWQGRRLVLEIDHINGNRWDNRLQNLRYLCPSCHSQTDTFSGRGRSHRRLA